MSDEPKRKRRKTGTVRRLANYKHKTRKQRLRRCAELYVYGGKDGDYTQAECLYMTYLSNAKYISQNSSKAFKRASMKRAIKQVENEIVVYQAKRKEEVVQNLENREDKYASTELKMLEMLDKMISEAKDDPEKLKEVVKTANALKNISGISQGIGTRLDKLQGRYVKEQENPENVKNDILRSAIAKIQEGKMKAPEPKPVIDPKVTDV